MPSSPNPTPAAHAELSEADLLSRILRLDDPAVTAPLHAESLLDLLWISVPELRWYFPECGVKVMAAGGLARQVARAELAQEVLADPDALARFLFLAHSRGDRAVSGAVFIDRRGALVDHRVLVSEPPGEARAAVREMMRVALAVEAAILVFHVHADGDCTPSAAETELSDQARSAAALLDLQILDTWVLAGPQQWSSLTDPGPAPKEQPSGQELARRPLAVTEAKDAEGSLVILLRESDATVEERREGADQVRALLAHCGGIAGLAATPPDELSCPGLPPPALAAVAAALEVARRLRQFEVPRRRPRSESERIAGFFLHRFARRTEAISGVVFTDSDGRMAALQRLTTADWQDATALRRIVLSLAVNNKATSVQPFTFQPDGADPEAVGEVPDLSSPIAAMRPYFDFEIRDHLGVLGDGSWHAGGQSGRLPRTFDPPRSPSQAPISPRG
jgi:DNA repair protein RadC